MLIFVTACSLSGEDVVARFLTTDHNGRNEEEAERIARDYGRMARCEMRNAD